MHESRQQRKDDKADSELAIGALRQEVADLKAATPKEEAPDTSQWKDLSDEKKKELWKQHGGIVVEEEI